jgi:hypothetical protein
MSGKLASLLGRVHGAHAGQASARKRQKTSHDANEKHASSAAEGQMSLRESKLRGSRAEDHSDPEDDLNVDEAGAYSALIGIMSKKRGAHAAALKQRQQEEGGDSEPEDSDEASRSMHACTAHICMLLIPTVLSTIAVDTAANSYVSQ